MRVSQSLTILLLLLVLLAISAVPANATRTIPATVTGDAALVKTFRGCQAMDLWTATCTAKDTLDVTFIFVNHDSSDTLVVNPSGIIFASSVACTVECLGDPAMWIDESEQPVEAGESIVLPAQIQRLTVIMSGAGRARAWAFAN